jgi:hypothetical protein
MNDDIDAALARKPLSSAPRPASSSVMAEVDPFDAAIDAALKAGLAPTASTPVPAASASVDPFDAAIDDALAGKISAPAPTKQDRPPIPLSQVPADVAKSTAQGLAYGVAGLPSMLSSARETGGHVQSWLLAHGAHALGLLPDGMTPEQFAGHLNGIDAGIDKMGFYRGLGPSFGEAKDFVDNLTGGEYQPKTPLGDAAKTFGAMLPTAGRNVVTAALVPALASETAGQLTNGSAFEPYARFAGAVLGGGAAALTVPAVKGAADRVNLAVEPHLNPYASAAREMRNQVPNIEAADRLTSPGPMQPGVEPQYDPIPGVKPSLGAIMNSPELQATGSDAPELLQRERLIRTSAEPAADAEGGASKQPSARAILLDNDRESANARTAALSNVQPTGAPAEVAARFRQLRDEADAQSQAAVNAVAPQADAADAAIGGHGRAETVGGALRQPVEDARAAAKENENKLWGLVRDDVAIPSAGIADAAKSVMGEMTESATPMAGEQARIFDVASRYGNGGPMPFKELRDLRHSITDEMAQQATKPTEKRRLTILLNSLDDALDHGIENQAALDNIAVSRGAMAPEDTMGSKLQREFDAFLQGKNSAANSGVRSSTGAPGGQAGPTVVNGSLGKAGRGPNADAGAEAVPGQALPKATPEDIANYKAAKQATRERAQTFDEGTPGDILKPDPRGGYKTVDAGVIDKVVPSGKNTDATAVGQYLTAGGSPEALADGIAYKIRKDCSYKDGTLDPAKVQAYLNKPGNREALAKLPPQYAARFQTAADARQAVDDLKAAQVQAAKDFNASAIGRVAGIQDGADVVNHIGSIFGSSNAVQKMRELAAAAASDPAAKEGLRRAIIEHMEQRLTSNLEGSAVKANTYLGFVKNNRDALAQVFSPQEMENFSAISRSLDVSGRIHTTKGLTSSPGTAQDVAANQAKEPRIIDKIMAEAGPAIAAGAAHMAGFGEAASAGAYFIPKTIARLKAAGLTKRDAIIDRAIADPHFFRTVMAKMPAKPGQGSEAALSHYLAVIASRAAAGDLNAQQGR